jgi:hypothetical protein
MEPLTDDELEQLLKTWVAPNTPQGLAQTFSQPQLRWWERLFNPLDKRRRREKRLRKAKRYSNI